MTKMGRNDLCFCGSGKKFKKCCENKKAKQAITNPTILTTPNKTSSFFQSYIKPNNTTKNIEPKKNSSDI
jgi:hypothetical protein